MTVPGETALESIQWEMGRCLTARQSVTGRLGPPGTLTVIQAK